MTFDCHGVNRRPSSPADPDPHVTYQPGRERRTGRAGRLLAQASPRPRRRHSEPDPGPSGLDLLRVGARRHRDQAPGVVLGDRPDAQDRHRGHHSIPAEARRPITCPKRDLRRRPVGGLVRRVAEMSLVAFTDAAGTSTSAGSSSVASSGSTPLFNLGRACSPWAAPPRCTALGWPACARRPSTSPPGSPRPAADTTSTCPVTGPGPPGRSHSGRPRPAVVPGGATHRW